ncbi:P-loop containing nucleoside triphosphate hydrolase protein, partial [Blyttiomyces helicus]
FRIVVADESHYLKSGTAKRTKAVVPILQKADHAMLLSGTPALSRPQELHTQISALLDRFMTMNAFGQRYCDGKKVRVPGRLPLSSTISTFASHRRHLRVLIQGRFGWDFSGNSNIHELHWFLERTVLIRRLKKNVLKQMPPKNRQRIVVDIAAKKKKELEASLSKKSRTLDPKMYTETGLAKLPSVLEYCEDLYSETEKKFIVFAHHREVLDGLAEFADFIRIDGSTPQLHRQGLCDKFQTDSKCRVAVLGITAAGVGLTLHAADLVVFAELFWNPAQLLQGEDRAHRIGRKDSVDIKYITASGTLGKVWRR